MAEVQVKCCSRCKQGLPISAFNKRRSRPDGLECWCRECYRLQHAANNREWARLNPKKNRERVRAWQKANPHIKRGGCPVKNRARTKAWRRSNPLRKRAMDLKREARKRSFPFDWTAEHATQALKHFGHACAACRTPFGLVADLQWDHWVPLNNPNCPGTVRTNMVPLCNKCNVTKSDRDANEWARCSFGQDANQVLRRIEAYLKD